MIRNIVAIAAAGILLIGCTNVDPVTGEEGNQET